MPTARAAFDRATLAFLGVLIALTAARIEALLLQSARALFRRSAILDVVAHVRLGLLHQAAAGRLGDRRDDGAVRRRGMGGAARRADRARLRRRPPCSRWARAMYGAWAGFWAGVGWLLMPGVFFSSNIISTDALLLPLWAIALFAMWRLMTTRAWFWAIVLGRLRRPWPLGQVRHALFLRLHRARGVVDAAGAGRRWRRDAASSRRCIALAILAPNIFWNIAERLRHRAAHRRQRAPRPERHVQSRRIVRVFRRPARCLGPIIFFVLIWLVWRAMAARIRD